MLFDDENVQANYQEAVDSLDVIYKDGEAYMSVHTVDTINASLMSVIDVAIEAGLAGQEILSKDLVSGALWVMTIWKHVHDELDLRAQATTIPDDPGQLVEDE